MRYSLTRLRDGAGDSGPLCQILDPESGRVVPDSYRPTVGFGVRVGSITARTYEYQDYWQTTPVSEILEDQPNYIKFKTKNGSIYEWKVI